MFDALDVYDETKLNEGVWLHLIDPTSEEPIYLTTNGKIDKSLPSGFKVRSTNSRAFEAHLDKVQRRAYDRARAMKGKKGREEMLSQLKKERPESFAALVAAGRNLTKSKPGEEVMLTPEELMAFAKPPKNHGFVDQVLERAADDRYYGYVDFEKGDDDDDAPPAGNAEAVADV